jgi:soluble lytic murein transglycosylase-like protein
MQNDTKAREGLFSWRNPVWTALGIFAAALVAVALVGGAPGWFAAGGLAQLVAGVIAAAFFLLLARLIRALSVSVSRGAEGAPIIDNAVARAILAAGVLLSAALVTTAAFGAPALSPNAAISAPSARAGWPARFVACEPYRAEIEDAIDAYWAAYPYATLWAAQIYQESLCDPRAVSAVGARGLAQFMPATWREVSGQLRLPPNSTPHERIAIRAGVFYMARLSAGWTARRPAHERHRLAQASYNAGMGTVLRTQGASDGALKFAGIAPHLPRETREYVPRIEGWAKAMGGCAPLAAPRRAAGGMGMLSALASRLAAPLAIAASLALSAALVGAALKLRDAHSDLDDARARTAALTAQLARADADLSIARYNAAGLEAAIADRNARIAEQGRQAQQIAAEIAAHLDASRRETRRMREQVETLLSRPPVGATVCERVQDIDVRVLEALR